MKAAILAGGFGTRMQEATRLIPKPMLEIGGSPILWHIMKQYDAFGVQDFCIALGYRSDIIKDYFCNYALKRNNVSVDLAAGTVTPHASSVEPWRVDLLETGEDTQTGGRLARMKDYLSDGTFFLTYGDGVSNIDLKALLDFHKSHGKIGTISSVRPPSRFGSLHLDEDCRVQEFVEKPLTGEGEAWINGGFFVFEPEIFDYVSTDKDCVLEGAPLEKLAADGQLVAYKHQGFWQCMDTVRDLNFVNSLWRDGRAFWKIWD